jgi:hypothetical protein
MVSDQSEVLNAKGTDGSVLVVGNGEDRNILAERLAEQNFKVHYTNSEAKSTRLVSELPHIDAIVARTSCFSPSGRYQFGADVKKRYLREGKESSPLVFIVDNDISTQALLQEYNTHMRTGIVISYFDAREELDSEELVKGISSLKQSNSLVEIIKRRPKRVLVVDRNPTSATETEELFRSESAKENSPVKYVAFSAHSLDDAIKALRSDPYDLVLLENEDNMKDKRLLPQDLDEMITNTYLYTGVILYSNILNDHHFHNFRDRCLNRMDDPQRLLDMARRIVQEKENKKMRKVLDPGKRIKAMTGFKTAGKTMIVWNTYLVTGDYCGYEVSYVDRPPRASEIELLKKYGEGPRAGHYFRPSVAFDKFKRSTDYTVFTGIANNGSHYNVALKNTRIDFMRAKNMDVIFTLPDPTMVINVEARYGRGVKHIYVHNWGDHEELALRRDGAPITQDNIEQFKTLFRGAIPTEVLANSTNPFGGKVVDASVNPVGAVINRYQDTAIRTLVRFINSDRENNL